MSSFANPECQLSAQRPGVIHCPIRRSYAHLASGRSHCPGCAYSLHFSGRTVRRALRLYFRIGGDLVESAIETVLTDAGISFQKTKRAERVIGFDQAPDFIVPDQFNPQIVVEAKLTEDDGTARDKITRVQHLGSLSMQGRSVNEPPRFEVIACIAGRGFKVRREDMKKLLLATRGKVFTLENLNKLVECSRLNDFRTK